MERLRCVVERVTYQNEENGFTVLRCQVKGYGELVTAVGVMPEIHAGTVLSLTGEWRMDAKYGRQFSFQTFEEVLPADAYGIEKYLGSGLIRGVGPKFARRIVDVFGADTLRVIEETPEELTRVSGIGKLRVERIRQSWKEQHEVRNIMLFLQSHNVSTAHATKIYKTYGNESIEIVKENPYRLADDIWGIGFKTADQIAAKLGFEKEKYVRLRSGLLYTLNQLADGGHCYATRDMLLSAGTDLLDVDRDLLSDALQRMIQEEDVITDPVRNADPEEPDETAIYLPPFYYAETGTARRLYQIYSTEGMHIPPERLEASLRAESGMTYDPVQLEAIRAAARSKILVLTGGPGTGKTTTTLGIIRAFETAGAEILLAAPTGRAAKRLSETTRMEAKTIHRLLEYKPPEGYQRGVDNPLEGDVLIVDECSMIDIMLMYSLLRAVPDTMTLILVGDIDQLPSVGAGNVLRDIIESGVFPVVRLTKIFRQAQASRIVMNAHKINQGKMPDLSNGRNTDFFFEEQEDAAAAAAQIVGLVKTRLPRYYKVQATSIQVLTPMRRGEVGTVKLNEVLQEALNPDGPGLRRGGAVYRARDKVMQIRNNYDKDVFNGDIGTVSSVDPEEQELTVDFDGRCVTYDSSELDELALAYAVTIHKAQGSEYPIVVMPVLMTHYMMLQRNLIYTGVTRAKKCMVIVGSRKALSVAIRNVSVTKRNTMLSDRIRECADPVPEPPPERRADPRRETDLFRRLAKSEFRSRFRLTDADRAYIRRIGMDVLRTHAEDIVEKRLAPAQPVNDGRQTPMRGAPDGHPVFLAQHATATCCRGCLEKWHGIPQGHPLTPREKAYVVDVILRWIEAQMRAGR